MTAEEKKMRQAVLKGAQLLVDNGLGDWKINLHSSRRALGTCYQWTKTIKFSRHFVLVSTEEQFEGVALHEIAHALVGSKHGHDKVFKQKCIEISPTTDYASSKAKTGIDIMKYDLLCPECGAKSKSNRNRHWICSKCKINGKEVRFLISERKIVANLW